MLIVAIREEAREQLVRPCGLHSNPGQESHCHDFCNQAIAQVCAVCSPSAIWRGTECNEDFRQRFKI